MWVRLHEFLLSLYTQVYTHIRYLLKWYRPLYPLGFMTLNWNRGFAILHRMVSFPYTSFHFFKSYISDTIGTQSNLIVGFKPMYCGWCIYLLYCYCSCFVSLYVLFYIWSLRVAVCLVSWPSQMAKFLVDSVGGISSYRYRISDQHNNFKFLLASGGTQI